MPTSFRCGFLVLATAAAGALGCSSPSSAPQPCQTSAECSATARCVSSTCVSNAPPTADVSLPTGPLEANLLLTFDGSSSSDPDSAAGDAIAAHAWVFRAISAGCEPPVVAGTAPAANVRFACPGTYAVDLTVVDRMGALGVATKEFQIGDYSGPPLLVIGPDVSVQHTCTTGPARCAPAGTVALLAEPTPDMPADVAFLWSVEPPPDRPLDANRRVTFDPGSDALSPSVAIETDGQAISGDWLFRIEARDAAGVVASGVVRVSVGNRPPAITRSIPVPDHLFDGTLFTASGEVPFSVADPDGDALVGPAVEWRHVWDGPGSLFFGSVLDAPSRVTFSIAVPYASSSDALQLIGGDGLERSILFSIADVNGAAVADVWPIVVGNRAPVLVSEATGVVVAHTYDPIQLAYRAIASLSSWSDPDGDPLMVVPGSSTGDPQCAQLEVRAGVGTVSCSLAFTGTPAVANFAGSHVVAQHVQDPWSPSAAPSTVAFTIANDAPTIDATAVALQTACYGGGCCDFQPDPETQIPMCVAWDRVWPAASVTVPGRWHDLDGDPLTVTVGASTYVCTPSTCAPVFSFGGATQCGNPTLPPQSVATTADDGAVAASATVTLNVSCL